MKRSQLWLNKLVFWKPYLEVQGDLHAGFMSSMRSEKHTQMHIHQYLKRASRCTRQTTKTTLCSSFKEIERALVKNRGTEVLHRSTIGESIMPTIQATQAQCPADRSETMQVLMGQRRNNIETLRQTCTKSKHDTRATVSVSHMNGRGLLDLEHGEHHTKLLMRPLCSPLKASW